MIKHLAALTILLFIPRLSCSQDSSLYRDFVVNFSKCSKLKVDGEPYRQNAMVYFEAQRINDKIELTRLVGVHQKEVYLIILETLGCMDATKIRSGTFKCIYLIRELYKGHKKISLVWKERDDAILQFIEKYDLPNDAELIEISYSQPIR